MGDVTRVTKEALDGQRVIKVFNAQEQEARDFETGQRAQPAQQHEADRREGHQQSRWCSSSRRSGLGGVLWMALVQVNDHGMTVGQFWGFLTALLLTTGADAHAGHGARAAAAGPRGRRQRVRGARRAHRGFHVGGRNARAPRGRHRVPRRELRVHEREGQRAALGEPRSVPAGKNCRDCRPLRAAASRRSSAWCRASTTPPPAQVLVDGIDVRDCNLRDLRDKRRAGQPGRRAVQRHASATTSRSASTSRIRRRWKPRAQRGVRRRVRGRSCRRVSTPRWAIAARCCRAGSASASPSRARCSRTRPS